MTNKDKFLRDGVSVEDFCKGFYQYLVSKDKISFGYDKSNVGAYLQDFLSEQTTPTLTEDERVILRNIDKKYTYIYRNKVGNIELEKGSRLVGTTHIYHSLEPFMHLFQFIKERRRILY